MVIVGLGAGVFALVSLAGRWTGELRPTVEIDLSPWALPQYTFYSLSRGLLAYVFSLGFTLVYGYWAAKDRVAERVLIPLLDILQSIPVLGFMPGLVLALVALFPRSNVGLELAAVMMIFTGQAWNMTFSFYHSLRSVPPDLQRGGHRLPLHLVAAAAWVELPFATIGLVWNSMMSMAGGWFFLMISEAFRLGDHDFRLPGLGSYMSVAVEQGRRATRWSGPSLAMMLMIVAARPVPLAAGGGVGAEVPGGGRRAQDAMSSLVPRLAAALAAARAAGEPAGAGCGAGAAAPAAGSAQPRRAPAEPQPALACAASRSLAVRCCSWLCWSTAAGKLVLLLARRRAGRVGAIARWRPRPDAAAGCWSSTVARHALGAAGRPGHRPVAAAVAVLQPVVQVVGLVPGPDAVPAGDRRACTAPGVSLGWGSIVLMLLGTQWYILFNVIAGAMAIPADLREAADSYRLSRLAALPRALPAGRLPVPGDRLGHRRGRRLERQHRRRVRHLQRRDVLQAIGLGARSATPPTHGNFPLLAASVAGDVAVVVVVQPLRLAAPATAWRRQRILAEQVTAG